MSETMQQTTERSEPLNVDRRKDEMNETTLREALKSIPRYVLDGPEGAEEYVPTPDGDLIFADDLDAALARADAGSDGLDVERLVNEEAERLIREYESLFGLNDNYTKPIVALRNRIIARLAEQGEQG